MLTSLTTKLRILVSPDKDTNTETNRRQPLKRHFRCEDPHHGSVVPEKRFRPSKQVVQALKFPLCKISEWIFKMKPSFADLYYYSHVSQVGNSSSRMCERSTSLVNKTVSIEHEPSPPRGKVKDKPNKNLKNKTFSNDLKARTRSDLNSFRKDEKYTEFKTPSLSIRPPLRTTEANKVCEKKPQVFPGYSCTRTLTSDQKIAKSSSTTSLSSLDSSGSHSVPKLNGKIDSSYHSMYDKTYKYDTLSTFPRESRLGNSYLKTRKTPVNAVQACIRLEEKERYRELLQQFTTAILPNEETFSNIRIFDDSQWGSSSGESSNSVTILGTNIPKDEILIKEKYSPKKSFHRKLSSKNLATSPKNDDKSFQQMYPLVTPPSSDTEAGNTPSHDDKDGDSSIIMGLSKSESRSLSTLEEVFSSSPYFSEEWIKEMKAKFETSARLRRREIEEEEMKAKIFKEQREAQNVDLEKQIRERLRIAELEPAVIEEDLKEEAFVEEFIELTSEMEELIEDALRPYPPNEVLVEGYKQKITRKDMETLAGLNWLNDEIINFYMNMLMERGENDNYPSVHAFNTFFYPKLISGGHEALKRWTRKLDIFSYNMILVPVHLSMHWCLAIIDFRKKCISYYDSMGGKNHDCLKALKDYLHAECQDKKKTSFDWEGWQTEIVKDIPQQMNGSDCGMFTCKYAEYVTRDVRITFSQEQMPYFRKRMTYEILTKCLL